MSNVLENAELKATPLSEAEAERVAKLAEECSEVIHVCMKVLRFGWPCSYRGGIENRSHLEHELGNLLCIVEYMLEKKDLTETNILEQGFQHRIRMLKNLLRQND